MTPPHTQITKQKQPLKDYHGSNSIKPYVQTASPFTWVNKEQVLLRLEFWSQCSKNQIEIWFGFMAYQLLLVI